MDGKGQTCGTTILKYKIIYLMGYIQRQINRLSNCIVDAKRFGLYIAVTNMLWPLIAQMPLRLRNKVMRKKNSMVFAYLQQRLGHVIDRYQSIETQSVIDTQAPIWVCWLQGEDQMPLVTRKCVSSIRKHTSGHPMNVLSLANYRQFVDLPDYIVEAYRNGEIANAHFADILRTVLLAEKGGCWIDSSIYMTGDLEPQVFDLPFYSCKLDRTDFYITENIWSNFFLASQKGGVTFSFVRDMFYEYLQTESRFIDYFMMDYIIRLGYEQIPAIRAEIEKVPMNNKMVHDLYKVLNESQESETIMKIFECSYIHKLNWRINVDSFRQGSIGHQIFRS